MKSQSKRTSLRTSGSEQPSVPLNNLPSISSTAMLSPSTPTHKSNTAKTYVKSFKSGSIFPSAAGAKPSGMFTGIIVKDGDKKIKLHGGILADSVYECTYLITDKV